MPLVAGPFLQLPDSVVDVQPGVWDFEADAAVLVQDLGGLDLSMQFALSAMDPLLTEPIEDIANSTIDDVLTALGTADTLSSLPSLDDVAGNYDVGNTQLTAAVDYAPAQAWVNPPSPYLPPDTIPPIATPTVPVDIFSPGDYVPTPSAPHPGAATVSLLNLTRGGNGSFTVGDQFQVIAHGTPGQDLTVDATFNGQDVSRDYGPIGASGFMAITGTMTPEAVGGWFESWNLDGKTVATFNFIVGSANASALL